MSTTSTYAEYLESLLVDCRVVITAAAEHGDNWPTLGLNVVLDKIDRLEIDHPNNPARCPETIDMLDKITS